MKKYLISGGTILSMYAINTYIAYAVADTGGRPVGIQIQNPIGDTSIAALLNKILAFLIQLGSIAVVLAIVWAGFLFVVAQGQSEKINQAKAALKWSIIGGAILLGAQIMAKVIQSTLEQLK